MAIVSDVDLERARWALTQGGTIRVDVCDLRGLDDETARQRWAEESAKALAGGYRLLGIGGRGLNWRSLEWCAAVDVNQGELIVKTADAPGGARKSRKG